MWPIPQQPCPVPTAPGLPPKSSPAPGEPLSAARAGPQWGWGNKGTAGLCRVGTAQAQLADKCINLFSFPGMKHQRFNLFFIAIPMPWVVLLKINSWKAAGGRRGRSLKAAHSLTHSAGPNCWKERKFKNSDCLIKRLVIFNILEALSSRLRGKRDFSFLFKRKNKGLDSQFWGMRSSSTGRPRNPLEIQNWDARLIYIYEILLFLKHIWGSEGSWSIQMDISKKTLPGQKPNTQFSHYFGCVYLCCSLC